MIIKKITNKEELKEIVLLHKNIFPDYFLSKLGNKIIYYYYYYYWLYDDLIYIAKENESSIGFSVGYLSNSQAREVFEKRHLLRLTLALLRLIFFRDKQVLNKIYNYLNNIFSKLCNRYFNSIENNNNKLIREAGLLSIGVLNLYRKLGVGSKLLDFFEQELSSLLKKDKIKYTIGVYEKNISAIKFYENKSFKLYNQNSKEKLLSFYKIIESKYNE